MNAVDDAEHGGAAYFARLVRDMATERAEDVTLERLVAGCLEVVPAADCAGLTLRRSRNQIGRAHV